MAEAEADLQDHYEVLQVSANAEPETIHRVYRLLASRLHPDNQDTGDDAAFRRLALAYGVLGDAEQRARYDATYQTRRARLWRLFGSPAAPGEAMEFERRVRSAILGVLYTKRRAEPFAPELNVGDVEELLGVPREHLDFSTWYLREKRLISINDQSQLAITVDGVEHLEGLGGAGQPIQRLLEKKRDG